MRKKKDYIKEIMAVIVKIAPKYGLERVGIFGSLVSGNFREDSDIDILVKFSHPIGFITFIRLENELSSSLKRKVDLVTEGALSPYFRDKVLKQLKIVYEGK